jgi:transposase
MLTGNVTGECKAGHNSTDFIGFLKKPDNACEQGKAGRFVTHFIPAHSSWLNMIERRFAEITNKRIRRESRESVTQLIKAIKDFIKE